MASSTAIGRTWRALAGLILAGMVLACGPAAPSSARPAVPATPEAATPATPTPAVTGTSARPSATHPATGGGPSPTVAGRDSPPDALLAAEGGDPVTGQLGTFIWLGSGSDAPWLPGAPIAVGTGEPLTVSLVPDGDIRAWSARYVPANATGPEGAAALGEGAGRPAFNAPGPGTWTVELYVEFAPAVGDARYFWRLEVE